MFCKAAPYYDSANTDPVIYVVRMRRSAVTKYQSLNDAWRKNNVFEIVLHINYDGLSTTTVNNDLHLPFEKHSMLYSKQSIVDYHWEALSGNSKKKRCKYQ